ncbi:MAG: hypothetical protein ACMG6E_04725 [Candidatus Roizmanbacteria bacterium]
MQKDQDSHEYGGECQAFKEEDRLTKELDEKRKKNELLKKDDDERKRKEKARRD